MKIFHVIIKICKYYFIKSKILGIYEPKLIYLTKSYNDFLRLELLKSRTLFISQGVDAALAEKVLSCLVYLDSINHDPIYLYINSPGGEVNSGLAIHDTIKMIKSTVKIINSGLCASIATIINCAVSKKHSFSLPNSKFLNSPAVNHGTYSRPSI